MKQNGGRQESARRPEEILAEIDRTRHEMDYTLSAIEHRLTPGQLVDQGIDYLRHSGANEFVHNLAGQVKYNPLPVTLVGIGLTWLMAAGKKQPDYGSTSYGTGLGERAGQMKDKVAEGTQAMRARASAAGHAASEKFGAMRDRATAASQSAKERIGAMGTSACHQVDRAKSGAEYMMREQPLALGAIGVAIGALLAALAPRTREEDELMGETRDRLVDQAKEVGQEKLEQAKELATAAMKDAGSQASKTAESKPSSGPQPAAQTVAPKVGADLTPRGPGGARGAF
jgi:ElaB/YqjD/DUF883 family membrane-anchored ribosome-binding protein